ncbi:MAG TPA: hypothetical protein VIL06_03585 [Coriobacteriia bacterium]
MGAELHIGRHLATSVVLFADRAEAGRALAGWIGPRPDPHAVVFALPRGGIPVGRPLADVPCSSVDSLARVSGAADFLWCFAAQDGHSFAVASFYRDFHDLDDAEVREALLR